MITFTRLYQLAIAILLSMMASSIYALETLSSPNLSVVQAKQNHSFQQFVATVRAEALSRGISQATIDKYLSGLKAPRVRILHTLHHQPQKVLTFDQYKKSFLSKKLIANGKKKYSANKALLAAIEKQYQVPGQILVAIWGTETHYGKLVGKSNMINVLVTLAFQKHRSDFYRKQLFAALKILNQQKIPQQAISAWDGGMGQTSFEPSVYFSYAVDFDHSGFANIWTSTADSLASIANYLKKNGWKPDQPWVVPAKLAKNLSDQDRGKKQQLTLKQWQELGVTPAFPIKNAGQLQASLIFPSKNDPEAFLVFYNFKVLMRWNHSTFEALCIGLLANMLHRS